jgi:hypothetical protein
VRGEHRVAGVGVNQRIGGQPRSPLEQETIVGIQDEAYQGPMALA